MVPSYSMRLLLVSLLLCVFSFKSLSLNYYWIGNSGNWTELSHWATTSGGSTLHTQIPTAIDDVFFDANSFTLPGQAVNFDALTLLAHSISWAGVSNSPSMNGPTINTLRLYGSLTLVTGMTMNFGGPIYFEATATGQTITTAGKIFTNEIAFNGLGGEWILLDDFTSLLDIALNAGSFNTNNKTVTALQLWSTSGTTRILNMGSSVFNLSGYNAWRIENPGCTIQSATSVINLTGMSAAFLDNTASHTYYDINFTGQLDGYITGEAAFHNVVFSGRGFVDNSCNFHNLTFLGNGTLSADNVFNNLDLTAGFTYQLGASATQTINGTLSATGNCSLPIIITSNFPGYTATISHPPATVNVSYVTLRDIHATGGANFLAANATDLGNNFGWTFVPPPVQNLYWIGNGGDWDDGNHWSHTSGGAPSGCAPAPNDNVFFDANSFSSTAQTVRINIFEANCRNMDWTGVTNTPTLASNSTLYFLNIFGSLKFVPGMNLTFDGVVDFEAATSGQTVITAGKVFKNQTRFNGSTGEWSLQDTFNCDSSLVFNCGTLNTNNQIINATDFSSANAFPRILNIGSSVFNLDGVLGWTLSGSNIIFNSGNSVINIMAPIATLFNGTLDVNNYYDVNFTGSQIGIIDGTANFHDVSFSAKGIISDSCLFHTATFNGDGEMALGNVYDNLLFSAGHTYNLPMHHIQRVNNTFDAQGTCGSLITITSNITDSSSFISKPAGNVNTANIVMRDVHGIGGATFAAPNSIDQGNNAGWAFNSPAPKNLYWIGNTGNWNDGNHWSLTSGGAPAGCAPTPLDNVFFDANSFTANNQKVSIIFTTSYCRSMDWSGALHNPKFESATSLFVLKIYGSLKFIPAMTMNFKGKVFFEATTTGNTIITANKTFSEEVAFNGIGGEWTFMDTFNSTLYITLNAGTLNTNNQNVYVFGLVSTAEKTRTLNMGSSVFYMSGSGAWVVSSPGITINCGTSVINCSAIASGFSSSSLVPHTYYNVNFGGMSTISGSSNFHDVVFNNKGTIIDACNFHLANFLGDADIRSTNVYDDLYFAAGHTYQLWKNCTQTINQLFNATGNCGSLITITSNINDSTTTISHAPGTVDISYVVMKDIHASGGASFTANNCLDLGNNTGWLINPTSTNSLYWIGNSGDWTDGNHWSFTSGGPPSGCYPSAINDVFFDANSFSFSFQSVLINVPVANCRSMNWTGVTNTPTFGSYYSTDQLNIYGSLTFSPAMMSSFAGKINFEATTPANTIAISGIAFAGNIAFNGTGEWTLQNEFVANNILFNNGTLNTNDQPVTANSFVSVTDNVRTLNMSATIFTLLADSAWKVENSGLTINAGTSVITCTAADGSFRDSSQAMHQYNDISFTGTLKNNILGSSIFHNVNFAGTGYIYHSNTFNDVYFNQDGEIENNNVFHDLNFTAEHNYILWEGTTQTINNRWLIQGTCTQYILLQTNSAGFFATVNCVSDTVFGHNIHIRDIHCTGVAAFMVYNSVDLGGNEGWNFAALPPLSNIGAIDGPTAVCAGSMGVTYQIAAVQGAINYQWTVPSGAIITSGQGTNIITVDFGTSVSGNITVQACGGCGCSNISVSPPLVPGTPANPAVTLTANPGNSVCAGTVVTFTAVATGAGSGTVSYDFKVNNISVQNGSLDTWSSSTLADGDEITCTITISGNNCITSNTASSNLITLAIVPQLTAAVSLSADPAVDICSGTAITFTAAATNTATATVIYNFTVNGAAVQNNNLNTYTSATLANGDIVACEIFLSNTAGACFASTEVLSNPLTIHTTSVYVNAGSDVSITAGETVQLNANGDAGTYFWSPSTGLSAINILNPIALPAITTVYALTITNASGCSGTDDVKVEVKENPAAGCITDPMIAITPNGDGINDRWIVWKGNCNSIAHVIVFNRYGGIVFESQHYQNDWQGTYKGKPLPDGTYYFIAEYKLRNGHVMLKRNNLTILR